MTDEQIQKGNDETKDSKVEELGDLEKALKEKEEFKSGWQRAVADYQNLQKETLRRQTEWAQMSEQQILEEFIPVFDNFKTAFANKPAIENKNVTNWIDGIGYIMKQFKEVLKAHKVEEIKTVGEKFDPVVHESAGEEESEKEHGIIIKEVSGGYKMGDRVIKPARVIISK